MTQTMNLTKPPVNTSVLLKRMLLGAGIGLILIALFLYGVENPKPEWGNLWMLKPLIMVPLAGAAGGAVYYFLNHLAYQGGWKKTVATILGLVLFIVGLWIGTVLGLNGTLWD